MTERWRRKIILNEGLNQLSWENVEGRLKGNLNIDSRCLAPIAETYRNTKGLRVLHQVCLLFVHTKVYLNTYITCACSRKILSEVHVNSVSNETHS